MPPKILDYASLGNWLWEAACAIRGPIDAPRFKNYILPLVFIKRLSDVFDDELARVAEDLGDADLAADLVEQDHAMVRFYMPPIARWGSIRQQATGLGEYLTEAVRAAALAPARVLGIEDRKGSIGRGKDADLVVFDERLEVAATVIGGTLVHGALDPVERRP